MSFAAGSPTTAASGFSYAPNISDDGGRVEFASQSTDLVANQVDANLVADIFLYTVASGQNVLVSHADGAPATAGDHGVTNLVSTAVLSGDGSAIAFESVSKNLVTPNVSGNFRNVYRYLTATGVNTLVSHHAGSPGVEGDEFSATPLISNDGKRIAFDSLADDLMAGASDLNSADDVFVWDAVADTSTLLSHAAAAANTAADNTSAPLAISSDGKLVLFSSYASDLMTGLVDGNRGPDLYVAEIVNDRVALVTHTAGSTSGAANRASYNGTISGDGQRIAFVSDASDLVAGDYNDYRDAFLSSLGQDFFTLAPCRVLDTRPSSALSNGVPRLVMMAGACGIPADARAVSINLTVTQPTLGGSMVAYAADLAAPNTNNLSFAAGQTRANNGILLLDTTGGGQAAFKALLAGAGTAHIVVDVNGYFR